MFPKIEYTPPVKQEETNSVGRSFVFDFEQNKFIVQGGIVKETDRVTAIKQWIELFIRVELNKYKIYDENFGTDFSDLVGYRLPRSYQVAQITKRINDGILNYCPNVVSVTEWKFDKGHFQFTVTTDLGEEVIIYG